MNMIITDRKNNAYANVCFNSPFSVKAEARDGSDGGYCALFYIDGRSVALGRKETLDEAKAMITDFISIFRTVSITNEVSNNKYVFDYDEPVEIEDETVETESATEDNSDNGEHF